jgi:glutathionyl-hydroquinone reductase
MAHGVFVDGVWHSEWYDTSANGGRFVPAEPVFRNWITPDGSPGPSGEGGFAAERGRYHLYVSLACPYAHRTVIFRKLKDLESAISISILDPVMGEQGWEFGASPGTIADTVNGKSASAKSICAPIRAIPAACRCRCCGTRSGGRSSITSRPRSSGCSTRRLRR